MPVNLNDEFFAKAAGWDVMKQARSALASGKVLSSNWADPVLRGVVQADASSYRAGLVIKSNVDIENLCTCRTSREWGTICYHSVAVGLHHLRVANPESVKDPASTAAKPVHPALKPAPPQRSFKRIKRAPEGQRGEPLEIAVIFPPNLAQALPRGKVMLYFEGLTAATRAPLNSIPPASYSLSSGDSALLDTIEQIAGDTPGMLQVTHDQLANILDSLKGRDNSFLGKSQELTISTDPLPLKLRATLQASGEISLAADAKLSSETLVTGKTTWAFHANAFHPVLIPASARNLLSGPVTISRSEVPAFLNQDWPALEKSGNISANFNLDDFRVTTPSPEICLDLTGGLANLQAKLHFVYGPKSITAGTPDQQQSFWIPIPQIPAITSLAISRPNRMRLLASSAPVSPVHTTRAASSWPAKTLS